MDSEDRRSEDYRLPGTKEEALPREEILFDIEMALRKEERLWPRRYRPSGSGPPDHDRFRPLAQAILAHLELCGLRFLRKPPTPGHRTPDPRRR